VTALPSHFVRLAEAVGCVPADDLVAECDLPPADTSAMDGWAVNGSPPWQVVGQALAGRGSRHPAELASSEAVVIATGARLPAGATGIVRSERGALVGTELQLTEVQPPDLPVHTCESDVVMTTGGSAGWSACPGTRSPPSPE
jgi:molybdopterin molybdotransferase